MTKCKKASIVKVKFIIESTSRNSSRHDGKRDVVCRVTNDLDKFHGGGGRANGCGARGPLPTRLTYEQRWYKMHVLGCVNVELVAKGGKGDVDHHS